MSDATVSDLIVVATIAVVLGIVAGCVAVYQAHRSKQEARAANRAVNNRPEGEPSLYELAVRAVTVVETNGQQVAELADKVDRVDRKVDRHLGWHQIQGEQATKRRWWR